jgi:hypothetical protein
MFDRTHGTTPLADFDVISIDDDMTGFPGLGISGAPPNDILLDVASSRGPDFVFLHAVANANLATSQRFFDKFATTFPSSRLLR